MQNKNMLASILFLFVGFAAVAQGSTPPPPMPPPPPGLPIDGGLVVLFLAAVSYGIYISLKYSRKKLS